MKSAGHELKNARLLMSSWIRFSTNLMCLVDYKARTHPDPLVYRMCMCNENLT